MAPSSREHGSTAYVYLLTLVAALGGLLFGYDTAVISGAIGFLQRHFHLDPQFEKGWAAASALIGCALGAAVAGMLSDRLGRKKVLVLAAFLFLISSIGTAFPPGGHTGFILFRILAGIGIGAASFCSPMYIAEISPARIRGRTVSVNQFAIVSGILVVYFVNYFVAGYGTTADQRMAEEHFGKQSTALSTEFVRDFLFRYATDAGNEGKDSGELNRRAIEEFLGQQGDTVDSQQVAEFMAKRRAAVGREALEVASLGIEPWNDRLGWRWMFGSGVLPSLLFLILLLLVPESPRWLVEKGRQAEALDVLSRVGGDENAKRELAEIEDAIGHESGSLGQLFEPGMRVALVIGVTLAILQQATGINVFLYFAPEIFKKMGSGVDTALLQTVVVGAVNLAFTVIAIWTVDRLGRKPLMLIGGTGMGLSLVAMGATAYLGQMGAGTLIFMLGYIACFALSVGPVTWVILAEIFPTRIRGRAMALATFCLWVANYVVTQTFTMMDENPALVARYHHAFPFWVYAALCVVLVVFVWRFVPETKGRTLEEIERSWGR